MNYYKNIRKTKNYFSIKNVIALGFLLILSACLSIKPGAVKAGKKLYETFFVGEEGTQYFIKPLIFTNNTKERLTLDITFRYKNQFKDSALVNISFFSKEVFKNVDSLKITNDSVVVVLKNMKFLFAERSSKKEFNSRFSTKGNMADINKLFNNADWKIFLFKQKSLSKYETPKYTKKKIDKLRFAIFMLF